MAASRVAVIYLLVLALAATAFAKKSEGPVKFLQFDDNLKASVIVIHAPSLKKGKGGHPFVKSPSACQDICASVIGCNGWVYCSNKAGCGSTCQGYLAANPVLSPGKKARFSDFVRPGSYEDLCQGPNWTYGLCSLKYTETPAAPQFWGKGKLDLGGFVSGTISLPKSCAGVSAATCSKCYKSKNPFKCLDCATSSNRQQGSAANVNVLLGKGKLLNEKCH